MKDLVTFPKGSKNINANDDICKILCLNLMTSEAEVMSIVQVITVEDAYYTHPVRKAIWEGMSGMASKEAVGRMFRFVAGYVVEERTDGKTESRLFRHYLTADGMEVVKEETPYSIMSSEPMRIGVVIINTDEGTGFLVKRPLYIKNTKDGKAWVRSSGSTVFI